MRNVTVEGAVASPRSNVWAVLADYPNIVDWNEAVKESHAIGDAVEGVGAQRQVNVGAKGSIRNRETVTEWTPEERMVIAVDQIKKQPIKQATMTFTLSDAGGTTPFTMSYDYEPKGGPLSLIYGQYSTGSSTRASAPSSPTWDRPHRHEAPPEEVAAGQSGQRLRGRRRSSPVT